MQPLELQIALLIASLLVVAECRQSKEIVYLRSIQPVEIIREANGTTETSTSENIIQVGATGLENKLNETNEASRDSRGLMKKFSFLAGIKAGGLISSSGTLAASNSLKFFGKVMNTALSVSYGHVNDLDPLPEIESDQTQGGESDEKEVRLKTETTTFAPLKSIRKQFIKTHNAQVGRINHKFLRTESEGRAS